MNGRLNQEEIKCLKDLGKRVGEIAQDPKWKEKEKLWIKKNSLQKTRPLVLCPPQGGWAELIPPSEYIVKDPFFGWYERHLKQLVYRYEHLRDDEVIFNQIFIPYEIEFKDWVEGRERPFDERVDHAATFKPSILELSDLKKLRKPEIWVNEKKSKENFAIAHELWDGNLEVIHGEPFFSTTLWALKGWGTSVIDLWIELRGMMQFLYDVMDEPEFTKEAMQFLSEGTLDVLKQGEALGIWQSNNNGFVKESVNPCGSNSLAFTDELPKPDYARGGAKLKDMWGYSMAQDVTTISADMLEEFVLPYQLPICDLFGLNSYGCCENNDLKWDVITKMIPRLRILSVSPYSNLERAVNKLQDKYVLAWKPLPGEMIATFDPKKIRAQMARAMEISRDCHMVFILREIETVYNQPERLEKWIDITMELAQNYY